MERTDNIFLMKPKVDFCFKELMQNDEVRKGFLSACLHLNPKDIKQTSLLPTHLRKKYKEDKQGILDIRILLNNDIQINVEMQLAPFKFWRERSLFYVCKMFVEPLEKGQGYGELGKCIHISILNFELFEEDDAFYSRFHLWEDERKRIYSDKLEIHTLELPKLMKHQYPESILLNGAKFLNAEKKEEQEG